MSTPFKFTNPPEGSKIQARRDESGQLVIQPPKYNYISLPPISILFGLFWVVVFGGISVYCVWYQDIFWVQIVGVLLGVILVGVMVYEVGGTHEAQEVRIAGDTIILSRRNMFVNEQTQIPIDAVQEIDILHYPYIVYIDPVNSKETKVFLLELSPEEDKVWVTKVLKLAVNQQTQRKV